jgi:ABC-2 type transport system permease protein
LKLYKRASAIAVSIILTAYFLSILSGLNQNLEFLKYFTPFKYFDAGKLFRNGQMSRTYLLFSAAIIVGCVAAAYLAYNRLDLYT